MKTYLECMPCFLRQSLELARLASDDPGFHEHVLREVCRMVAGMDLAAPPPALARTIHDFVRGMTGVEDPYHEAKQRFNRFILDMLPRLESMIDNSADPYETALRLAIAGNIIDFGINSSLVESDVERAVEEALHTGLDPERIESLRRALLEAQRLLYVGDNAGEVVFDRLFISQIRRLNPGLQVTFATRGAPILNDITREDAITAGIDRLAALVDTGDHTPGCLLEHCSEEFHAALAAADLVVCKGQGNYETLSELEQRVFYLLKVKCPVIARELGLGIGALTVT